MNKKRIIAGLVFLAGAALLAAGIYYKAPAPSAAQTRGDFLAVLRGFEPGTDVRYRIFSAHDKTAGLSGEDKVGQDGTLRLPAYKGGDRNAATAFNIQLRREGAADPLDLTLTLDPVKKIMALQGAGLEKFADVTLQAPGADREARADWAGIIKDQLQGSDAKAGEGSYKVAFGGMNIASDTQQKNPHMIEVFTPSLGPYLPGGGWYYPIPPPGTYINVFHCPYPYLSTCDPAAMIQQNLSMFLNYVSALMSMTDQFSSVMMQQAQIIGTFLDAKQQMETQRELQALTAEAHKDYHPSEQMCHFGTFVRSVARTEEKGVFNKASFDAGMISAYTNKKDNISAEGYATDMESRIRNFRKTYCDPADNNNGMKFMCDQDQQYGSGPVGAQDPKRINRDINFAAAFFDPLTLDIDYTDGTTATADETDVIELARNLYWPRALDPPVVKDIEHGFQDLQDRRSLIAQMSVAQNSFSSILALKSSADKQTGIFGGWNFMKSMLQYDFGIINPDEVNAYLGNFPSYYAQMEVLTKKIYQNPDFYTNLYDKPANIERISVAMDAISLMQARDFYESRLRSEMLTSMLLEKALDKPAAIVNDKILRNNSSD